MQTPNTQTLNQAVMPLLTVMNTKLSPKVVTPGATYKPQKPKYETERLLDVFSNFLLGLTVSLKI